MNTRIDRVQPNLKAINPNAIPHLHKEGEVGAVLEYYLSDTKTGLILPRTRVVKKSESFVAAYLAMLFAQMKQCSYQNPQGYPAIADGIVPLPTSDPTTYDACTGTNWFAAIFTASATYTLGGLVISGGHSSSGKTATASIRATSANLPTGPDLDVGTVSGHDWWANTYFTGFSGMTINSGTTYAICVRSTGSWGFDYKNGSSALSASSTDSGSIWVGGTRYYYYQVLGGSGLEPTAKDTSGAGRWLLSATTDFASSPSIAFDVLATTAITNYGIRLGTGLIAPTINDYALQTPIAEGSGAGQMNHGAVTFGTPAADSTTSQFTITRNMANNSGGLITVNEIGLYCRCYYWNGDSIVTGYFMIIRDVIGGGIAVPNGQTLTVNYRPQATI
jgi:hypothetical protein